jgi:membrane protease YdiL (CAAX protease family)
VNLLFLAPWLLVYLLCWWWAGARVETAAAASLGTALRLLGARGLFLATLAGSLLVCLVLLARIRSARKDAAVFPWMLVEGIAYGLVLHVAAAGLSRVAPMGRWLGLARWARGAEEVQALGIAVGAGIFEELVFRGLLCTAAWLVWREVVGGDRWTSGAVAVVASSLLFAAYHHWGPGGEPWDAARFTFRFHAGAILGVVFLTRGLGIAAFAHGLYDALVLLG